MLHDKANQKILLASMKKLPARKIFILKKNSKRELMVTLSFVACH